MTRLGCMVLGALLGTGCTTLPDVDEQTCGNLVLDATEDCDGFSAFEDGTACGAADDPVYACRYICDPDESATCPAGWGCGDDYVCRRPTRAIDDATSSYSFEAIDLRIADVDGDDEHDIIGYDGTKLTVRYGDSAGGFDSVDTVPTDLPIGKFGFGDLDQTGRTDVLIPSFTGLTVLLGSDERTFDPVLYAPFDLSALIGSNQFAMFPVESVPAPFSPATELLIVLDNDPTSYMGFLEGGPGIALPGSFKIDDLVGRVDTANVDNDAAMRDEWLMAFEDDTSVWVYSTTGATPAELSPVVYQQLSLPGLMRVRSGAFFADVDGDTDIDVLISARDASMQAHVLVAYNNGSGVLAAPVVETVFNRDGLGGWPIAVGQIDYDPRADYVYADGIHLGARLAGGSGPPDALINVVDPTIDAWQEAVIGDFNGDDFVDVAVSLQTQEGLEVYLNSETIYFNRFFVDTDEVARGLRSGDFDGDVIDDVAFVERVTDSADRISVLFGEPGGPDTEPVAMGSLGLLAGLFPVSASFTAVPDGIEDLFVVADEGSSRSIAALQGSSSRRMSAPFILTSGMSQHVPLRAFIGKFDSDDMPDVAAVGTAFADGVTGEANLWIVPGTGTPGGLDDANTVRALLPSAPDFHPLCAEWISGDIDGDGLSDVVGVDDPAECINGGQDGPRMVVALASGTDSAFTITTRDISGSFQRAERLHLYDLDADGDLDLIVAFEGRGITHAGSGIVVFWNDGSGFDPTSPTEIMIPSGGVPTDAAPFRATTNPEPDLMVVASDACHLFALDVDTKTYPTSRRLDCQIRNALIQVADLDGDGLEDMALASGEDLLIVRGVEDGPLGAELLEEPAK